MKVARVARVAITASVPNMVNLLLAKLIAGVMIFLATGIFAASNTLAAAQIPNKKRLILGETMRLALPGVKRVRLSREGIVYARHGSGNDWLLTGTARGVVLLHPDMDAPSSSSSSSSSSSLTPEAPEFVIEVFVPQPRSGSTSAARNTTGPHGSSESVESLDCNGALPNFGAFEFLISMVSHRQANEYGLPARIDLAAQVKALTGTNPRTVGSGLVGIAVADNSGRMDSKVVAKPRLVLFPGTESLARSGGEFRIEAPVLHQSQGSGGNPNGIFPGRLDIWKEYGLSLRAKWTGCIRERAVIDYEVSVTQRISGSEQHLLAGRISGKRSVTPGGRAFGGAVEFASGARSSQGSYWLENIPILGPLFSRRDNEDGEGTMTVWVQALSEVNPDTEAEKGPIEGD